MSPHSNSDLIHIPDRSHRLDHFNTHIPATVIFLSHFYVAAHSPKPVYEIHFTFSLSGPCQEGGLFHTIAPQSPGRTLSMLGRLGFHGFCPGAGVDNLCDLRFRDGLDDDRGRQGYKRAGATMARDVDDVALAGTRVTATFDVLIDQVTQL